MSKYKIAIAEDRSIFRNGLVKLLNSREDMETVIEAENGKDLLHKMVDIIPDLIFMDFQMPEMNGLEATKQVFAKYPNTRVLMLSNYDDEEIVVKTIEAGASGYITKEEDIEEIFKAIESVQNTGYYLNDRTSKYLVGKLVEQGKIQPVFSHSLNPHGLSDIEIEVIKLMGKELTTKEIANKLFRGLRTIEGYKSSIMQKTGAKNACGVIMFGVKSGIIKY